MKLAEKLKTLAVKVNPPRHSREYWLEKTEVGAAPGYRGLSTIRGIGRSLKEAAEGRRHYAKNFARIQGLCKGCEHYNPENQKVGGHCKRKEWENCVR